MNEINMECESAERMILMYRELAPDERMELERHIAGCDSCARQMELQTAFDANIRQAARLPLVPVDAERLTMKVMARVNEQKKSRMNLPIFGMGAWLRYTMAAVSLILVVTFYAEYSASEPDLMTRPAENFKATLEPRGKKVLREKLNDDRALSLYALIKK